MSTVNCGITPKRENPEWDLTTTDIKNYIQNKFNQLTTGLRKMGKDVDDVKITLTATKLGKSYVMAVLALPTSVLKGNDEIDDIPSVFRGQNSENRLVFEKPFFDLINNFRYTKNEEGMFRNASFRQNMQLSNKHVNALMSYMKPRVMNAGKKKYVFFAIDLIKVMHSMLVDKGNPKQSFRVEVQKSEKIDDGVYKITVKKIVDNRNANPDSISKELQRSLHRAINP